jgi:hypothetical protein
MFKVNKSRLLSTVLFASLPLQALPIQNNMQPEASAIVSSNYTIDSNIPTQIKGINSDLLQTHRNYYIRISFDNGKKYIAQERYPCISKNNSPTANGLMFYELSERDGKAIAIRLNDSQIDAFLGDDILIDKILKYFEERFREKQVNCNSISHLLNEIERR